MYKKICITNRHLVKGDFLHQIDLVLKENIDYIILREKDLSVTEYNQLAKEVLARIGEKCILHSFVDVAKALNHPKIHLTMDDFLNLTKEDKAYFKVIGVSTHTVEEAKTAYELGATYITASHIFPTNCKKDLSPKGLSYLKEVCEAVDMEVYALGGIHENNIASCIEQGASGVCMMSEYMLLPEKAENSRYDRQLLLSEVGDLGQRKLKEAKVLIVGAGGLGSPAAMYLAAAGIGTIGLIDNDNVSLSNLNRQLLHPEKHIGMNKANSGFITLTAMNPETQVDVYPYELTIDNAEDIFSKYDFILDCVDNYEAKFLINDVCVKLRKPFCHGGVLQFHGQVLTYVPGKGPCFRCIFEDVPDEKEVPHASTVGVIGAAAGVIGSIQAIEAIKYILGIDNLLTGKMYIWDGLTMESRIAKFPKISSVCPVCNVTR